MMLDNTERALNAIRVPASVLLSTEALTFMASSTNASECSVPMIARTSSSFLAFPVTNTMRSGGIGADEATPETGESLLRT